VKSIARFLSTAADSLAVLSALAIGVMILHITADVVIRFVWNAPISGTITAVSLLYMPLIVFLPLAYTEKVNGHISVELVYDLCPRWLQSVLDYAAHALSLVTYALLSARTWTEAISKYKIGSAEMEGGVRIVTWPSYFFLPVGFALIVAVIVYRIVILAARRRDELSGQDSAKDTSEELHVA
jgi:TRAP-type C4-dicarboxylate transport system permease small subunit